MGISRKREEQHADRRGPHQARADACHRDGALRVRKDLPPAGSRTDAGSCVAVRNCPWSTGTVLYESICILISEPAARHYPDNNKNAQA